MKCSTRSLLRPLTMDDLESAFLERDEERAETMDKYRKLVSDYKDGKPISEGLRSWFGNRDPPIEELESYCDAMIRQTEDSDIREMYMVYVGYQFMTEENRAFHASLNPRVTFGYSNALHEECDCIITDRIRNVLLSCFEYGEDKDDCYYNGAFECTASGTSYEDLTIYRGDRIILSTVSHEGMFTICLNDADIEAFSEFEGKRETNEKTLRNLSSMQQCDPL
jgi:hypothetical protein